MSHSMDHSPRRGRRRRLSDHERISGRDSRASQSRSADGSIVTTKRMTLVESGGIDVCLVDYRIGGHTGLEFRASAKVQVAFNVPMILLTGVGQRDIDVAATEVGAADFLDKSDLSAMVLDRYDPLRDCEWRASMKRAWRKRRALLEIHAREHGSRASRRLMSMER